MTNGCFGAESEVATWLFGAERLSLRLNFTLLMQALV